MNSARLTNVLLGIIASALTALAARPYLRPEPVRAETQNVDPLYVEPGISMLRIPSGGQVLGKVVVNLRTGAIFGFPTGTTDPYPSSPVDNKPQTSHGVPLGHFALADAR